MSRTTSRNYFLHTISNCKGSLYCYYYKSSLNAASFSKQQYAAVTAGLCQQLFMMLILKKVYLESQESLIVLWGRQHRPQQPLRCGGWRVLLRQRPSFRTKYWQPLEVGEDYCGCAHIVLLEGDAGRQYEEGLEIKGQAMQRKGSYLV